MLSRSGSGSLSPRAAQRALLLAEESYTTVLLLLVLDVYGPELLTWAPETIRLQLEEDFSLSLPKATLDKVMAGVTLLTTNYFFKDVTRFIELCNILAGDDFQPDEFDPADAGEILWGVTEAALIWPPERDETDDTEFGPEVRGYIEEILHQEGLASPPDVLRLGLRSNVADTIRADYADDPEMFEALWQAQESRSGDLKQMVLDNLQELAFQLKLLALQNGSTEALLEQIEKLTASQATTTRSEEELA